MAIGAGATVAGATTMAIGVAATAGATAVTGATAMDMVMAASSSVPPIPTSVTGRVTAIMGGRITATRPMLTLIRLMAIPQRLMAMAIQPRPIQRQATLTRA